MRSSSFDQCRDAGLLVVRLGVGFGMFYFFGFPKLTGGATVLEATGRAMAHFGITSGHYYLGLMAGLAEGVGGLLLMLGLFFRPAALAMAFVMVVAFVEQLSRPMPIPAHPFNNFWVFLGLCITGPGQLSLDYLLRRRRRDNEHDAIAGPLRRGSASSST